MTAGSPRASKRTLFARRTSLVIKHLLVPRVGCWMSLLDLVHDRCDFGAGKRGPSNQTLVQMGFAELRQGGAS